MTNLSTTQSYSHECINATANDKLACTLLQVPLIVDLDGTLTPTDTLIESIILLVKQSPLNLLRLPFWLFKGRAVFKDLVASRVHISVENLPYHESLLAYLRKEKAKGRQLILATAAHKSIAENIAAHLDMFDEVIATEAGSNLKGQAKLAVIQEKVGAVFVYAGDSHADIPIWQAAQAAILVGVAPHLAEIIRRDVSIEQEFFNKGAGLAI